MTVRVAFGDGDSEIDLRVVVVSYENCFFKFSTINSCRPHTTVSISVIRLGMQHNVPN